MRTKGIVLLILLISLGGMYKFSEKIFPIVPKIIKRGYIIDYHKNRIEHSKWSPINKIDVATFFKRKKS